MIHGTNVIEMFCDRVAASKIYYGKDYTESKPYEYFDKERSRNWIHAETSRKLEELLVMLRDKGEDETFRYIKNVVRVEGKKTRRTGNNKISNAPRFMFQENPTILSGSP